MLRTLLGWVLLAGAVFCVHSYLSTYAEQNRADDPAAVAERFGTQRMIYAAVAGGAIVVALGLLFIKSKRRSVGFEVLRGLVIWSMAAAVGTAGQLVVEDFRNPAATMHSGGPLVISVVTGIYAAVGAALGVVVHVIVGAIRAPK